jgi:hypothetical protein
MSSAMGPFAVDESLVEVSGDVALVRIHNTNTGKIIRARFALDDDQAAIDGGQAMVKTDRFGEGFDSRVCLAAEPSAPGFVSHRWSLLTTVSTPFDGLHSIPGKSPYSARHRVEQSTLEPVCGEGQPAVCG